MCKTLLQLYIRLSKLFGDGEVDVYCDNDRDGVAGFVLVMSILGAVVLVVAVGTVAYKKSKRMAMSDHGSDFLKPENSCVNVKSYGSTHDI